MKYLVPIIVFITISSCEPEAITITEIQVDTVFVSDTVIIIDTVELHEITHILYEENARECLSNCSLSISIYPNETTVSTETDTTTIETTNWNDLLNEITHFKCWQRERNRFILCPDCPIGEITISTAEESHSVSFNTNTDHGIGFLDLILSYR